MAVRVLPHSPARPADQATSLPGLVLAVALVPSALDLLKLVQPGLGPWLAAPIIVASGAAAIVLLMMWLRFPRTNWLAAAGLAAAAGFALRLIGADVAALLSLLSIVAIGLGGGFASSGSEVTQPGV
jgi:hypothetical protein